MAETINVQVNTLVHLFKHCTHVLWHLGDHILTSEQSACSKDKEDVELQHQHLKEVGYFDKIKDLKLTKFF